MWAGKRADCRPGPFRLQAATHMDWSWTLSTVLVPNDYRRAPMRTWTREIPAAMAEAILRLVAPGEPRRA